MKKVLILGSGGLKIGQAGEFDYSGSQAIKALKEENIQTVLINPNIATVQTDEQMADKVYLQPLNIDTVTKIIKKERPDGIILSVGGQTALNLGLDLESKKILKKYCVSVLGTDPKAIRITEDRDLFKKSLSEIGVKTAKSYAVKTVEKALEAAEKLGYPIMLRSAFSLGGLGSGIIQNKNELKSFAKKALNMSPQILIEECLLGWKEIEYEIVRDKDNNCIAVCNMENFDPMGIHTGESIVVAPSQTLTNREYHYLREVALKTVCHLGIIGECNIQYAFNPEKQEYRVIEVNARLSRSSALASKATGYPLAFVSTKIALGKRLWEIKNSVTKKTCAFFEPALDYIVVKIPRWDIHKLQSADRNIGSEMKSVGETMGIGRTFPEALQKALRMLNIGSLGIEHYPYPIKNPFKEIKQATDRRLFAIFSFLEQGGTIDEIYQASKIDKWFLFHIQAILEIKRCISKKPLTKKLLLEAKKYGLSDKSIALIKKTTEQTIRKKRIDQGITPVFKQIDTLAGEFVADTNYLYSTYHGSYHDITPSKRKPIIILGSGPYSIGSSVEFDWCAVNMSKTLRKQKKQTVLINSNPETVSTDYDESDRLYFEELTEERVKDIADFESPEGIIVSVGGQIANNMALSLYRLGYPILGTSPIDIDRAENRKKFSTLLNQLNIDQPLWDEVSSLQKAKDFAKKVGYPVLLRPSYVLSGAAMNVVFSEEQLAAFIKKATLISPDHPLVISEFINNAKELEVDGVAKNGEIVIDAIAEHIENAGIHSGDATIVLPPQRLYLETIRNVKKITRKIVKALNITGPFNMQFIAINNAIKVIECNVRASRSFPFVSKVTNQNFIQICAEVFLNKYKRQSFETLELDYVGVKSPQFSYQRLKGSNPVAHVEMASTGEVACLGENLYEAFYQSWLSTEKIIKGKRILLSIGGDKKHKLIEGIKKLSQNNWEIFATKNTCAFLFQHGIESQFLYKASDNKEPNILTIIAEKQVDLIINIPRYAITGKIQSDGYLIRRAAIDHHIPLITNLQIAQMVIECLTNDAIANHNVKSWQEFVYQK